MEVNKNSKNEILERDRRIHFNLLLSYITRDKITLKLIRMMKIPQLDLHFVRSTHLSIFSWLFLMCINPLSFNGNLFIHERREGVKIFSVFPFYSILLLFSWMKDFIFLHIHSNSDQVSANWNKKYTFMRWQFFLKTP